MGKRLDRDLLKLAETARDLFKEEAKKRTTDFRKLFGALESGETTFYVAVLSYWSDEGEKHVRVTRRGTLDEVFAYADNRFSRVNQRTDKQRAHDIYLVSGDLMIPVPDEICRKYLKGYQKVV